MLLRAPSRRVLPTPFVPSAGGGGGGFTFAPTGGGGAAPVAFGSANAGLFKKEDVSLGSAADVEPIASALKAQTITKLSLIGAPVDCDETPTVSDEAATALRGALEAHGRSVRVLRLVCHRFESEGAMEEVMRGVAALTALDELNLTNSSLRP